MTGESKNKRAPAIPVWLDLVLVVVLPAALYLSTLAPTLTWAHNGQDGGDLVTAVYTSGVPHPPGYPTYVLLGKLFALLPVSEPAYRLNLMSEVCAVLTTAISASGPARSSALSRSANPACSQSSTHAPRPAKPLAGHASPILKIKKHGPTS